MVALVNRARNEEYQELLDTVERFQEEIARETRKGKFTFAALEEVEYEYDRLTRWTQRVQARDLFQAERRGDAYSALESARASLAQFAGKVYDNPESSIDTVTNGPQTL